MQKFILFSILLAVLVSCGRPTSDKSSQFTSHEVKTFRLSDSSTLRLSRNTADSNLITLSLLYEDGSIDALMGISNKDFILSDNGDILFDTVCLYKDVTSYILRLFDISSTYGAETWYVFSPYYSGMPDGPWNMYCLPFDRMNLRDVDGDGVSEIVAYSVSNCSDSTVYSFHKGVCTPIASPSAK